MKQNSMRVFVILAAALLSPATAVLAQTQTLESNAHYERFKRWAIMGVEDSRPEPNMFKFCIEAYEKMIESGIAPTTRVREQKIEKTVRSGQPKEIIVWEGSVQEIREKWCDAGLQKLGNNIAEIEAPYRKALKNDKLKMVVSTSPPGHIFQFAVPGGEYTRDAGKLAAASVWFDNASAPSNERQVCPTGGKRIFLRRYSFDANHNLLNNTSREYCGDIPASGYK